MKNLRKTIREELLKEMEQIDYPNDDPSENFFMIKVKKVKSPKDIEDFRFFDNIKGFVSIDECSFIDLDGLPKSVDALIISRNKRLASLKGCPQKVRGGIGIDTNYKLKSLEGGPQIANREYTCSMNGLTSLKGAPKSINGLFNCSSNELTSLEGGPQKVSGNYQCLHNNIASLKGFPKSVGGDFDCRFNPGISGDGFTEKEIRSVCDVKGKVRFVNSWKMQK